MFNPTTLQQMPTHLYQLCQILQQASQILQAQYALYCEGDDFDIVKKADQSPVTQADLLANTFLTEQLAQLEGHYSVLSEEGDQSQRHTWNTFWMIDPLDGTKEFIKKTGEFTINLSLIKDGESVISALAVPLQQKIYITEKNELPYRYTWQQDDIQVARYEHIHMSQAIVKPIKVGVSRRLRMDGNYGQFFAKLSEHQYTYQTIEAGSAYKFCLMLEGEIDVYPRFHGTSEWDTAAGQGLLQSIGGELFTLDGRPFLYNQRDTLENQSFLALQDRRQWAFYKKFIA